MRSSQNRFDATLLAFSLRPEAHSTRCRRQSCFNEHLCSPERQISWRHRGLLLRRPLSRLPRSSRHTLGGVLRVKRLGCVRVPTLRPATG